jgi:hypothetical protein
MMRYFLAIFSSCAAMLVAFSLSWSLFVVTHHSYGGPARFSQVLGTIAFLGIYLLPLSILCGVVVVWPIDRFLLGRFPSVPRSLGRAVLWIIVAGVVYVGVVTTAGSSDALGAVCCALFVAIVAALLHNVIKPGSKQTLRRPRRLRIVFAAGAALVAITLAGWYLALPSVLSSEEQELIEAALVQSPDVSGEKEHVLDYRRFSAVPLEEPDRAKEIAEMREVEVHDPALHDALEDFIVKNSRKPTKLRFAHPLPPDLKLLAPWIRRGAGLKNWDHYQAILDYYPLVTGVIEVSPAGISRDGMMAIIGLSHYSSGMSGAGAILVFRRVEGRWILQPGLTLRGWLS